MKKQNDTGKMYAQALKNEQEQLLSLDKSVPLKLKDVPAIGIKQFVLYAASVAAFITLLVIVLPESKTNRELKTLHNMTSRLDMPASGLINYNFETNQIDRLNNKIIEFKQDDMVSRLNEKMKKYKQQKNAL